MLGSQTPPTLTDGTVTLRAHSEDDIDDCVEQCRDPLTQRWTTVPVPYSRDDARTFIRMVMPGGWATDEEWGFAIEAVDPATGLPRYAGTVSLRNQRESRAEIAYASHPWARGHGLVERALRLVLEWGFTARGLRTVIWWANAGNWASRKVAWRVGFSFDGTVRRWLPQRGEMHNAWVGTLTRDDPREARSTWLDVPRIIGDGIVLRRHRDDDAERVLEACTDERTQYWLGHFPLPSTAEHAADWAANREAGMAAGEHLHWVVADPGDDRLLGTVSLLRVDRPGTEVGYWMHPEGRSRGLATEAVRLAVRHGFIDTEDGGLGLARLTAYCAVDNTASRHVLEASGFLQTGLQRKAVEVRGGMHDLAGYDILRGESPGQ